MKKIIRLVIILAAVFLVGIKGVKADTVNVTQQFVDNVWSFHYRNGSVWTFGNLPFNYANGKLVYCIQPDARITTNTYNVYSDFTMSGYSDDVRRQMELISYYGYGYPGHDSLKYYMATQELMWLYSNDDYIRWTVGNTDDTPEIDVSYEKSEIQRLINSHNVLPSFFGNIDGLVVNKDNVLVDTNNVLSNYDVNIGPYGSARVEGNRLILRFERDAAYTLLFTPKVNYNQETYIYDDFSIRTQTLASFGKPDLRDGRMIVSTNKTSIDIVKKDNDTHEIISESGIKVKIKNLKTKEENEYEFVNGRINVELPIGKYEIEEIKTISPYVIGDNLEFEIKGYDDSKEIEFFNKKAIGKITINKNDEDDNKLNGVEFEVYDKDGNVVDTMITENGEASSKELSLGESTVKETKELYGYKKNDTIYEVKLDYKDQNEKIVVENLDVKNEKIKCEITYITTSGDENIDVSFNIYDKDGSLVYSGETVNGKASIPLPYGDYIIREIGVPNGYKLNDEEISFSVNDKVCASTLRVNNEKVVMPITSTQNNCAYILLILFNLGGYLFVKKNS